MVYMKFFATELIETIQSIPGDNIRFEVVGKANINEWGGTTTPQIFIEQIEFKENSILDF